MSRATRGPLLQPLPALILKAAGVLLLAALIFWVGMSWARDRHAARAARLMICEAQLREVVARNPLLSKGVFAYADPCVKLSALTGGR